MCKFKSRDIRETRFWQVKLTGKKQAYLTWLARALQCYLQIPRIRPPNGS